MGRAANEYSKDRCTKLMSHFCLLADPAAYSVSDVDVLINDQQRDYWVKLFADHFEQTLESALIAYGKTHTRPIDAARRQFTASLAPIRDGAYDGEKPLGIIGLCKLREQALRDHGLHDPFRHIKRRENESAIAQYHQVIRHLTAMPDELRWERIIRGIFAGNIFDLGSPATMGYTTDSVDFDESIDRIKPRPWLVDGFDAFMDMLPLAAGDPAPWAKVVIFVDNAGADFILGIMPLARQLAGHATRVVLAANEHPSLNDVTADEAVDLIQQLGEVDPDLAGYVEAGLFEVVSTGNDIPLIDLSDVSDELNAAADDADFVILEGMGRTVESNWNTLFDTDALQLCLLKDPDIAARINGELFDCVCKFDPVEFDEDEPEAE